MLKRLLTGVGYLAVLIAFYVARFFCRDLLYGALVFDALILVFGVIGTFEVCRALGDRIDRIQHVLVQIFSVGVLVCYAVCDCYFQSKGGANYAHLLTFSVLMAGIALLLCVLVFRHEKTELDSVGASLLALLYPTLFLLVLSGINHTQDFALGLLFVFAICPFADSFAFVFGKAFKKKLPRKMAPQVSPNKTVIGGIGGIVGAVIGATGIFFLYYGLMQPAPFGEKWLELLAFIGLGALAAIFAEVGDLVESAIKRKLDIKDMGNLLPGHGGILDRIDSALYCALVVGFALLVRIMILG